MNNMHVELNAYGDVLQNAWLPNLACRCALNVGKCLVALFVCLFTRARSLRVETNLGPDGTRL